MRQDFLTYDFWQIEMVAGIAVVTINMPRYFKFLERKGFIISHSGGRGYKDGLFCLTDPNNAPLEHPKFSKTER